MRRLLLTAIAALASVTWLHAQDVLKPLPPLPTEAQTTWADHEFYLFVHFGPNTFTGLEWGTGAEHEEVFAPEQLDCRQWCRIAKAAGAKGIILTAKHHDGFCLWPSQYSGHTVAQSRWMNGRGDVLRDLSDACREYGLGFGVYLSPWDRNHPKYGTPDYNGVFTGMMREVVKNYGPLFELWWDGANGEGPNGKKQAYDFALFEKTIREIAPGTIVFSDIGPDARWGGNEEGTIGDPNWNLLNTAGFTRGAGSPPPDTLNHGNINGQRWIPAECDVSIRPGWFWHAAEDSKVKTPKELFRIYLKSVGRGANLLLNVPADSRGLFTSYDSASLVGFRKLLEDNFRTSLLGQPGADIRISGTGGNPAPLTDGNIRTYASLSNHYRTEPVEIRFRKPTPVNCLVLQEPIHLGQRVKAFRVVITREGGDTTEVRGTTIGHKRLLTFPTQAASAIRLYVTEAKATPLISTLDAFRIADDLAE